MTGTGRSRGTGGAWPSDVSWLRTDEGSDGACVASPGATGRTVGRSRPSFFHVATAGSDPGEPGPTVRDGPSSSVAASAWVLPSKEFAAPIGHLPVWCATHSREG